MALHYTTQHYTALQRQQAASAWQRIANCGRRIVFLLPAQKDNSKSPFNARQDKLLQQQQAASPAVE